MATIPGSAGLPVLGDKSVEYYRDPVAFVQKQIQDHGRIFVSRLLSKPTVFLASNKAICELLHDRHTDIEMGYKAFMQNVYGDIVLFSDGEQADKERHLLAELFSKESISHFPDVISRLVNKVIDTILPGDHLCVYKFFKKLMTEISLCLFLNVDFDESQQLAEEICDLTTTHWHGIISVPLNIKVPFTNSTSTFSKAMAAKARLLEIIQHKLETESHGFLHQAKKVFPERQQAINHVLLLTSALVPKAMASVLTSFVITTKTHSKREKLMTVLESPEWLDCVLQEIERLWPPFQGGRRLARKDIKVCGYKIPKGHAVVYCIYAAQRDPAVFHEPNTFNPDRWLQKNADDGDKLFCYGTGSRSCLGKHIVRNILKTTITTLISKFDWKLSQDIDIKYKWLPVSRPIDNVMVTFLERKGNNDVEQLDGFKDSNIDLNGANIEHEEMKGVTDTAAFND